MTKGNYKNGKKEGSWKTYNYDGTFNQDEITDYPSGNYKNNIKISD